jgi:hypothetical protein
VKLEKMATGSYEILNLKLEKDLVVKLKMNGLPV